VKERFTPFEWGTGFNLWNFRKG